METPESPISKVPVIFIDYIEETEETKIYVHGVDDHLYSNITIEADDTVISENFTYELHLSLHLHNLTINVIVWDKEDQYEYLGNLTIINPGKEAEIIVVDEDHKEPVERSLPYSIIMERV